MITRRDRRRLRRQGHKPLLHHFAPADTVRQGLEVIWARREHYRQLAERDELPDYQAIAAAAARQRTRKIQYRRRRRNR